MPLLLRCLLERSRGVGVWLLGTDAAGVEASEKVMPAAASAATALARARATGDAVLLLDAEKVWWCLRPRGVLAALEGSEGPCLPPRGVVYWSRG